MRLLLVRHGQSEWNAGRILQGQRDIPLSALGRAQADALAPVVADLAPDRSVASDMSRARETAERLAAPSLTLTRALRENALGEWEGRTVEDLVAADPDGYRGWRAGRHTPPNGEPWAAFGARVAAAIEAASEGARCLLVVTHGAEVLGDPTWPFQAPSEAAVETEMCSGRMPMDRTRVSTRRRLR